MANQYYCEIDRTYQKVEAGIYTFTKIEGLRHPASKLRYIDIADRVWKENDNGVFWIKHRYRSASIPDKLTEEDMKEFMWIKLKARDI